MKQLEFPLLQRLDAPSVVPAFYVQRCKSYREAVKTCWGLRRIDGMSLKVLAMLAELRAQLVSDYLHTDDGPQRRNLPAEAISRFEMVCGNTFITQWLAAQSALTVLEEMQAARVAA